MKKETKPRILYILKILYELTDEDNPLTTAEIASLLEKRYGLQTYRTTISSDIEQLKESGFDIYVTRSTQNRYFMNDRLFDIPELKLLIDAVESSRIITEKKSEELVDKLLTMASRNKSAELKRNLCIEGRLKQGNERIYYIVWISGIDVDFDYSNVSTGHYIDLDANLYIDKFRVKWFNAKTNHIVSLLDKWTIGERIKKDDVKVVEQMEYTNAAQITKFIREAEKNGAVNVAAALTAYRNEHFADFDTTDGFVLY